MKKLLTGLILFVLFLMPLVGTAHADVNTFTITDFTADYYLSNEDPQGSLRTVEQIDVTFTDNNHGLLRAIPQRYKGHSVQLKVNKISSDSGAPSQYSTYSQSGNTVLKIGDPNRTVTGPQSYTIDYTVKNVISFYEGHDELYWDINGDDWPQTFLSVTANIHLPDGLKMQGNPSCYAGSFGDTSQRCTANVYGQTVTTNATMLQGFQTLTVALAFDKGYFKPHTWRDTLSEYLSTIIKVLILPVIIIPIVVRTWLKRGRDDKGRGTIVPEFDPPKDLGPLQAGAITDFSVDNRDITATIIDLSIRGYIRIHETKKKKLLKDKLEYELELTNTDYSKLNKHESQLMGALFDQQQAGQRIQLADLKNKFYKTASSLKTNINNELTSEGYFKHNPSNSAGKIILLVVALGISLFIFGSLMGAPVVVGGVIAILVSVIFIFLMPARTAKGVAAKEHLLGLKMYLETAEKDRIKLMQSPDAKYASNSAAPTKTVELFEKLLPFAVIMGVEAEWAKQFEHIYTQPPDWYSGHMGAFNSVYLASHLSSGVQTSVNSAFSSPSSSGGSGSGGGGFSGGGGGGGGGGGW